ncbi:MAG: pyridoxal-phosphate dependent enzyme, partial [Coprococcus sp.]|nr:pyridoxal-phosphate dependent enzyme [Coprococcus sp.]
MNHLPFMPTPLMALPYYSKSLDVKLLCKRDDLFIQAGGGSNARMLQYILADVSSENCDVLLTAGGPCSNFNRACALMCAKIGIPMHLIEYTDELKEFDTSINYFICKLSGIQTTRCNKSDVPQTINEIIRKYSEESKKVKYVYGGGKSVEGIYAYYDAIKELYDANAEIDHLFVACGTGTTLTGICAGM